MAVLIAYASARGSTAEIAERIGHRLADRGLDVTVGGCPDVPVTPGADAVVVGSAIHNGEWLTTATDYVTRLVSTAPAALPVWAFSVGMVGDDSSALPRPVTAVFRRMLRSRPPAAVRQLREHDGFRGHHRFSGRFTAADAAATGPTGRRVFRALGGRYGDHRHWPGIDAWSDGVATGLGR